jgi:hypothetical protein
MAPRTKKPKNHKPVFIGGTQRSGTSLLRALIDSNTDIFFPQAEMKFFVRFNHRLKDYEPIQTKKNLRSFLNDYGKYRAILARAGLTNDSYFFRHLSSNNDSWASVYDTIMTTLASSEKKSRWGEKSPGNEYFSDQILSFYPNAKIICTIRDPRGVIASSRRRYTRGFIKPMIRWKLSVRKIIHDFKRLPAESFQIIFYEDLILDFENTMQRVFDFLETKPFHTLDRLQVESDKWGEGGTTSYPDRKKAKETIFWKHTLNAYKDELGKVELKMIERLTKSERCTLGYHSAISHRRALYHNFMNGAHTSVHELQYHPLISRILNRLTDRSLLTDRI